MKLMFSPIEKGFQSKMISPLDRFPSGFHGTVVEMSTDAELQGRLMGMGLFIGTRFQLLRGGATTSKLPFLLAIDETRIALDPEIAKTILVAS